VCRDKLGGDPLEVHHRLRRGVAADRRERLGHSGDALIEIHFEEPDHVGLVREGFHGSAVCLDGFQQGFDALVSRCAGLHGRGC